MKHTVKIISIFIFFLLASCVGKEEELFEKSAAQRIQDEVTEVNDLLLSAPNGWVMYYFPTESRTGVHFLLRFQPYNLVQSFTINKFNQYAPPYKCDTLSEGLYKVLPETGAVISFETGIQNIHYFSDPTTIIEEEEATLGVGFGGDFQFRVFSKSEDKIIIKGVKRGVKLIMRRLADTQDYLEFFQKINSLSANIFNTNAPQLFISANNSVLEITKTKNGMMTYPDEVEVDGDMTEETKNLPYLISDNGLILSNVKEVGGLKLHEFVLNDDQTALIDVDNPDATITGPVSADYFFTAIDRYKHLWAIAPDEDMSPAFRTAYERVANSFSSVGYTLTQISFRYNTTQKKHALYIEFLNSSKKSIGGYLYLTRTRTGEDIVKHDLSPDDDGNIGDVNGRASYNNRDGMPELVELLFNSFKVEAIQGRKLIESPRMKLTGDSNPEMSFTVKLNNK